VTGVDRLALLAHELRSPVAALDALAARAAGPAVPDGVRERLLELAIAAAGDVVRLLSDPELLSLRPVTVELRDLLDGVAAPDVHVSLEPATLVCDATRVRQAVGNLVANGLRHGRSVSVDATRGRDRIYVEVSDDGPGLEPGVDPFPRGVSGAGSTGYGLWLARAIAEAHGGALEVVPSPRRGSAFRLSLPLATDGLG
jgi:two-component system OmpR family sensor kinase